ncbi:MAG: hypothetical protein Q8L78_05360 [Coxiellaceae bacterium]|nr:hypothetical protein [Coxiellaceae bacterium]
MNNLINRDTLLNIKYQAVEKIRNYYTFIKLQAQNLNKRQRVVLFSCVGLIILLVLVFSFIYSSHHVKSKTNYPVHFETLQKTIQKPKIATQPVSSVVNSVEKNNDDKLQVGLNKLETSSNKQMQALQIELQIMQSRLTSLASQDDIQKLQQTVSKPNQMLLGKMNSLQNSVQKVVAQTAKKTWVDPVTVQKYFHLVAVQGFSDGMRTIIDVDGNQTALSKNEICPVCRGWVLQHMNFSNQSAVFSKQSAQQTLYVKLQTN